MICITQNNKVYGPYDEHTRLSYDNNGQTRLHDIAKDTQTQEVKTVSYFLKKADLKVKRLHGGDLIIRLRKIGTELIVPEKSFVNKQWLSVK